MGQKEDGGDVSQNFDLGDVVHKISEGRNFGVGNVVVQMVWVHKVFFKFLSVFSITRTKTYLPINI